MIAILTNLSSNLFKSDGKIPSLVCLSVHSEVKTSTTAPLV
jgi:hypothetical protein